MKRRRFPELRKFLTSNGFILGLGTALILASAFPKLGSTEGPLHPGLITKAGVIIIFLTQGLSLPTEQMLRGMLNWRLQAFVQSWNFILAPVAAITLVVVAGDILPVELAAGFLFLSFLPTTVSSAIALTATAEGNVAGAIFNTSLSNILGVLVVPLWTLLVLGSGGFDTGQLLDLLGRLSILIILPLLLGQLLRLPLRPLVDPVRPYFKLLNNGIIIFMVFAAVSDSMSQGSWHIHGSRVAVTALLGTLLLLTAISAGVWTGTKKLFKDPGDRAAAFYCSSQKSLATGVPMAATIFGVHPTLADSIGFLLLPLIIYHPAQLVLGSLMLKRLKPVGPA